MTTKEAMTSDDDMGKGGPGNGNNDDNKGKAGCPGKCVKGNKGDNYDEKDSLINFVAFALRRIMILCSGKGDGKVKGGFDKGDDVNDDRQ
jgi:hypothetical protein